MTEEPNLLDQGSDLPAREKGECGGIRFMAREKARVECAECHTIAECLETVIGWLCDECYKRAGGPKPQEPPQAPPPEKNPPANRGPEIV